MLSQATIDQLSAADFALTSSPPLPAPLAVPQFIATVVRTRPRRSTYYYCFYRRFVHNTSTKQMAGMLYMLDLDVLPCEF